MKYGDIYYYHERVWSEEEMEEFQPHPNEVFRHVYIKLIKHKPYDKNNYSTCDNGNEEGAWACYCVSMCEDELDRINDVRNHTGQETNVTYCTKFIRENFKRVYDF